MDMTLANIQEALKKSMKMPINDLPHFLRNEGKILPGIGTGGQTKTREELDEMSEEDALLCQFRFIIQHALSEG